MSSWLTSELCEVAAGFRQLANLVHVVKGHGRTSEVNPCYVLPSATTDVAWSKHERGETPWQR